jgi:predicted RNA-binding protein Jag
MNPDALHLFVSELLRFLDVAVDSVEIQSGHRTVVAVTSPEGERLVGPSGEHLRALNAVARRLAEAKYGSEAAGFLIDVNGYHESQLERSPV